MVINIKLAIKHEADDGTKSTVLINREVNSEVRKWRDKRAERKRALW